MQTTQDLRVQQLEIKYFEIDAQHGTCVNFSQKSAGISKSHTLDTDDRQEFFPT